MQESTQDRSVHYVRCVVLVPGIAILRISADAVDRDEFNSQISSNLTYMLNSLRVPLVPYDPSSAAVTELGSLLLNFLLCDTDSLADGDCKALKAPSEGEFQILSPDGQLLDINNMDKTEDGYYQALNIPLGIYLLSISGVDDGSKLKLDRIKGPAELVGDAVWIYVLDPNNPAAVELILNGQ